jgi:hypothetical protein
VDERKWLSGRSPGPMLDFLGDVTSADWQNRVARGGGPDLSALGTSACARRSETTEAGSGEWRREAQRR